MAICPPGRHAPAAALARLFAARFAANGRGQKSCWCYAASRTPFARRCPGWPLREPFFCPARTRRRLTKSVPRRRRGATRGQQALWPWGLAANGATPIAHAIIRDRQPPPQQRTHSIPTSRPPTPPGDRTVAELYNRSPAPHELPPPPPPAAVSPAHRPPPGTPPLLASPAGCPAPLHSCETAQCLASHPDRVARRSRPARHRPPAPSPRDCIVAQLCNRLGPTPAREATACPRALTRRGRSPPERKAPGYCTVAKLCNGSAATQIASRAGPPARGLRQPRPDTA